MLDVKMVRKERHRKLDAIQEEIDGSLAAIDRCHSPIVIKRIEEKIDVLDAKKLRLGGKIKVPKEYDFEQL